ncbi:hypothetical protein UlMin_014716 [Ulmus minor]
MDSRGFNCSDIYGIYRSFCDIRLGHVHGLVEEGYTQINKSSREALVQLSKIVESKLQARVSVFEELRKLMSQLDLTRDFSEFSGFYDFVFFVCRDNGQKNITVAKAVAAWRLVLAGRFRLLNQWCNFVEKNPRHNISEDTWRQVLAFSRCVHENLEGYDPAGAWPVLIDDFVEHMYSVSRSNRCNCGYSELQLCINDDSLPGLRSIPGLKRKSDEDFEKREEVPESTNLSPVTNVKRSRFTSCKLENGHDNSTNDLMDIGRHNTPLNTSKAAVCAVEGCLSKGFAGLFTTRSCHFRREKRVLLAPSYKASSAGNFFPRDII